MEKAEMITELYNLRSALFLIDVIYAPIYSKEEFESLWYDKHNWNTWDTRNTDITHLRLYQAPLVTAFDPTCNSEWDFWGNVYKMYCLNSSHPYFKAIEHNMKAYHLLFDWIFDNKFFVKKYSKVYRSAGLNISGDREKMSPFFAIINTFRYSNINVLNNSLSICEDALTNKKSKLLKYYNRRQIEKKIIPEIQNRKIKLKEQIENGAVFNRVKNKYGIANPRSEDEAASDNRKVKEMQEALELIKQQYKVIDSRDWKNIDSVIYLLETGRADTIKEALNLADTKKFRENILGAVYELNKTMARGFNAILANLDYHFGQLFSKLDLLKEAINGVAYSIEDIAMQVQASSESIASSLRTIESRIVR